MSELMDAVQAVRNGSQPSFSRCLSSHTAITDGWKPAGLVPRRLGADRLPASLMVSLDQTPRTSFRQNRLDSHVWPVDRYRSRSLRFVDERCSEAIAAQLKW